MKTKHPFLTLLLTGASLFLIPPAHAAITGTMSAFDVLNPTGSAADDFQIELGNIDPSAFGSFHLGDYPTVAVTDTGTGAILEWSGGNTPSGSTSHFGFTISGDSNPTAVDMHWSMSGTNIGSVPDARQSWNWMTDQSAVRDTIFNSTTSTTLYVQRRVAITTATVNLGDLVADGDLWNNATLIDSTPVAIAPGTSLIYDFPTQSGSYYTAVMMYEVQTTMVDSWRLRYLNTAWIVPEPTVFAFLGLAGLAGFYRKRERRQTRTSPPLSR